MSGEEGKLQALKNLEADFNKFQEYLPTGLNIYEITGMGSREIKHSNIIAWFLDPRESHSLDSLFFKEFITLLYKEKPDYFKAKSINIQELSRKNFDKAEVIRESEADIDILFKSRENKFVLCIENKVRAGLSKDQLKKYYDHIEKKTEYKDYNKVFVLLSPAGYEVPDGKSDNPKEWIPVSYKIIINILNSSILKATDERVNKKFKQKIQYIINDYVEHLENEGIVENDGLKELCKTHTEAINLLVKYLTQKHFEEKTELSKELNRLYKEYQKIFEFLVHRQSQFNPLKDVFLNTLILDEFKGRIIKSSAHNNFREFYTPNMDIYFKAKDDKSGCWKNGLKYKYLFVLGKNKPKIILQLSPKDNQDVETKAKFEKILESDNDKKVKNKTKIAPDDECKNALSWEIDIDLSNLSRIDEKSIVNEGNYIHNLHQARNLII